MKYNNITITSIDHFGRGIAKIDNKITFVINALPKENVDIKIIEDKKKYNIATVLKYNKISKERREVKCKYYNRCGGCNIMHMNYNEQLLFKKNKVINILDKYANALINPTIIKSNKEYNYRNKVTMHSNNNKQGFYINNTNNIINIDNCMLLEDVINNNFKKYKLKELIIRSNEDNNYIDNTKSTNSIIKTINNIKFKVNINSFFQVNDYICSKLFKIIDEHINKNDIVLDLYSGVGTLGIVACKKAKEVISVEVNNYSFNNIKDNIKLNNISNIKAINSSVEEFIKKDYKCNTIILDPPRNGLNNVIIDYINSNLIDKIIYISCNPMTLARDIKKLNNYKIENSYILDMFPNTYHVESVVLLTRE